MDNESTMKAWTWKPSKFSSNWVRRNMHYAIIFSWMR